MRAAVGAAMAAVLASCIVVPVPGQPASTVARPTRAADGAEADFIARLDAERARIGCPRLVADATAAALARAHSADMERRGFFDHTNPDGASPFDRMRAAGIRYTAAAENIAQGPVTGGDAYRLWHNSAGHRRNMLDCRYTHHGLGVSGTTWTQVFYRP